jgi:hypothetical protein
MKLLPHGDQWKTGVRVMMLKGRHKDGLETERRFVRVALNPESFDRSLELLSGLSIPGERIYATAGPRDLKRASRVFKERLLENDYAENPEAFFERLDDRWFSCLMNSRSQVKSEKVWLFDCDEPGEEELAIKVLRSIGYDRDLLYSYKTKNGAHLIVKPFNKGLLPGDFGKTILLDNPLMLWGF